MFFKYVTLFLGISYFAFAAVLLLKKSPIKKANNVLCFLFMLMAAYSIELSLYYTALLNKNYSHLVHYAPFDLILLLMFGPVLYLYVKTLLGQPIKLTPINILVQVLPFIPAITFIVYFLFQDTTTRLSLLIVNFEEGLWHTNLLNVLVFIQLIVYLFCCYLAVKKQFKISSKISINNFQMSISWLRFYIVINLYFMLLAAPLSFYLGNEKVNLIIAQLAMLVQFAYLFVKSMWHSEMFSTDSTSEIKKSETVLKISDNLVEDYFRILMTHIETQKPFLKEECSIHSVSMDTGIPVHHLSNILNNHFQKNFPDFINEYRIKEVQKLLTLTQYEKMTLEAIGYECGFGSRSSFNKAFKKHTGFTPSQFRQQN